MLDVGSLDINGNNRHLFENCEYVGLDVAPGRNVDVVSTAHRYGEPDESFDVVYSEGSLHHFRWPREMISEMWRVLKPGGDIVLMDLNPNSVLACLYAAFVRLKGIVRLASKGEIALMQSIRDALPEKDVVAMFSELGIECSTTKSLAGIFYEAAKPGL